MLIWLTYTTAIVYKTRDRGKTKKEMATTVNETINTNNDKVAFNNINDVSNLDPEEYYDKMANEYNNVVVEKWGYKMPQEVTKCLLTNNISKDLNILDLGCGNGLVGEELYKNGYVDITGVDISDKMMDMARKTGSYKNVLKSDLSKELPFDENSYSVLVCVGTTTYLDPSVLHDWCKVIKKGGYLIFTHKTAVWKIWEPVQKILINDDKKIEQIFISEDLPYLPGFSDEAKLHERARIYIYRVLV